VIEEVKAWRHYVRAAPIRLQAGVGQWESRAATANISGGAFGKDRRSYRGQPFTNSLGMKFVPLGDVQISIWETRVQDYEAFCRATGRRYEPPDFHQTPTDPVVKVSWFDAVAFCKWLTEKEQNENLIDDRESYRLPTDAEWSMAVGL
jgi:formylglycine-generating enzyme required for sulfatase activity